MIKWLVNYYEIFIFSIFEKINLNMKKLFLLFLFVSSTIVCQTNTAIYVFDTEQNNETYQLTDQKNISNSKGYNSQPFFL